MRMHVLVALGLVLSFTVYVLATPNESKPDRVLMGDSIGELLDSFHDAAAHADGDRYFGHFTETAVFLGTDPTERWTVAEFRAWAEPYFAGDEAWTYHAVERHVEVAEGGRVAWFDEVVRNKSYGDLRGTGVVVLIEGEWKIAQYNLTFMVPNDDAKAVLEIIKPGG